MPCLTLGDIANREHPFYWNDAVGAYCYEPKDQKESDDIIASNWVFLKFPWRVAPVWEHGVGSVKTPEAVKAEVSKAIIPPYVNPTLYDAYPVRDLLDLCADAGFTPEGDQADPDNLRRQLHRYYEGRAWASEEMRRVREKMAAVESAAIKAAPIAPSTQNIKPVGSPVYEKPAPAKKRGRPAKVRDLQPA